MKKHAIYLIFLILSALLEGCPGAADSIAWRDLGSNYIYHEVAGLPSIEKKDSGVGIPGVIISYDYDKTYIIALSKNLYLLDSISNRLIINGDYYKKSIADRSEYWIIVKGNDSIYGPFDKDSFLNQRISLKVSDNLKLKE